MAGKILDGKEAAAMLGVTEEQLNEMRMKGEVFGRRDGSNWTYKSEEIDRVIADRGGSGVLAQDDFGDLLAGLSSPTQKAEGPEAILVSEEALGRSPEGTSSTIIGKKDGAKSAADSDLQLNAEPNFGETSPSGILGGSDVKVGGSGTGPIKAGGSDLILGEGLELGEADLDMGPASGKGPGSGVKVASADSDLQLALSDIKVMPEPVADDDSDSIDLDSDSVGLASGSVIGSGIGSDVTMRGGDSGINLKPTDSGLSLEEEPLDLGGSAVDSLELPEDDDVISLDSDAADPDQATQLKQDDQFLLSPTDSLGDDDSDSGSQVIALEDSEGSFDADAATMLRSAGAAPLADDAFAAAQMQMEPFGEVTPMAGGVGMAGMPGMAAQPMYVQVPIVEAPYSVWNVLGLFFVTIMMICCAMLMVDILLNMWWFDNDAMYSTALMDAALSTFGLDQP
jgi:hypothetical protein